MGVFFQQCTALTATLASAIADSAGASADGEMVSRAGRSLGDAFRHFNNFANWQWCLVEAPTILITAPFSPLVPGGGVAIAGSATGGGTRIDFAVGNVTGFGVLPLDFIQGAMFASNSAARVSATATAGVAPNTTASVGFANAFNPSLISTAGTTAYVTANRDNYDLPADFKKPYSVRFLEAQYTISFVGRRFYDRSTTSEFTPAGTPLYYTDFNFGQAGKLQLLRPPAQTDRAQVRYYCKMDPLSGTANIPDQFAPYLIAYAKTLFLADKDEAQQRGQFWLQFAMNGLTQMLKENENIPDENLMMLPGHYAFNSPVSPNSTRQYMMDEWG